MDKSFKFWTFIFVARHSNNNIQTTTTTTFPKDFWPLLPFRFNSNYQDSVVLNRLYVRGMKKTQKTQRCIHVENFRGAPERCLGTAGRRFRTTVIIGSTPGYLSDQPMLLLLLLLLTIISYGNWWLSAACYWQNGQNFNTVN